MNAILEFLKHPLWLGAPTWAWLAIVLGVVVEGILGHASNPRFRSMAQILANGLRALLVFLRVGSIPVIGPIVVGALEVVAGVDLDGDGKVGDRTPPAPPKLVIAIVAFLGVGHLMGCSTVSNIVKDASECAGPACKDVITKIAPAIEVIIVCEAGGSFSADQLPACAINGLQSLAAAVGPDGWRIVGCVVNAIEKDATKPPPERARAKAAQVLAARKAAGL